MSRRVFKSHLSQTGITQLTFPPDTKILGVQLQGAKPVIYYEIEENELTKGMSWRELELMTHTFMIILTGDEVPRNGEFLGTLMLGNGNFVVHVYEIGQE
ncbi:DUF7352 domain-containing protein [Listeria booriae]|uniref:DUF7352 domain-containing protein n=1 Tax=Listeria booriae TaxID=1552123 RepID=UPI0016283255|nr:hypothetical protein [Listeria booriae]MBC1233658.1 hypothetical protein [Listeria booriae]